jgi:hypothetical protein
VIKLCRIKRPEHRTSEDCAALRGTPVDVLTPLVLPISPLWSNLGPRTWTILKCEGLWICLGMCVINKTPTVSEDMANCGRVGRKSGSGVVGESCCDGLSDRYHVRVIRHGWSLTGGPVGSLGQQDGAVEPSGLGGCGAVRAEVR